MAEPVTIQDVYGRELSVSVRSTHFELMLPGRGPDPLVTLDLPQTQALAFQLIRFLRAAAERNQNATP